MGATTAAVGVRTVSNEASPGARDPHRRVPEFFIVGHHKSGTTALYQMLKRHPQIFMPEVKAPRFFASDLPWRSRLPGTLEEYLTLFEPAAPRQRIGEASQSYLSSTRAAETIAEVQPDARIIAILREPASFLRSLHLQYVQARVENERDLAMALALEPERRRKTESSSEVLSESALLYSEHVRYVEQLRRYESVFPREQILVLIYDDFRRDNETTVRRVLDFIGVEATVPIEVLEANPSVRVRAPGLRDGILSLSLGDGRLMRRTKPVVKALTSRRLRRRALSATWQRIIFATPHPADESLMQSLRARFKPEAVALSEHLDRDLVRLWGYDRIE